MIKPLDPTALILEAGRSLIDRIWPDKEKQAAERRLAELELLRLQQSERGEQLAAQVAIAQQQSDVNKEEARSGDKFQSRWRPFIGWVCGSAFAYKFVVAPLTAGLLPVFGYNGFEMPVLDVAEMLPVLFGMLGLGAFRSYEKVQGKA
jgi:hypothetical protein